MPEGFHWVSVMVSSWETTAGMADRLSPSPLQQQVREQAGMSTAAATYSELMGQGKLCIVAVSLLLELVQMTVLALYSECGLIR